MVIFYRRDLNEVLCVFYGGNLEGIFQDEITRDPLYTRSSGSDLRIESKGCILEREHIL